MKVSKERNPYLRRICPGAPHKYSFQMQSGQYLLHTEDGTDKPISKIGTFKPKFRKNFTGFVYPKDRYEAAELDKTALHYAPNLNFQKQNSYYTPTTRKFIGYAQQPYKLRGRQISQHLSNPDKPHTFKNSVPSLKKSQSERKDHSKTQNIILNHSATTFMGKEANDHFFETSFTAMNNSKPLPKKHKATCYNYRCKYLQKFTFDQKGKTMANLKMISTGSTAQNTLSKTFYEKQFDLEKKQFAAMNSVCG